MRGRKPLPSNVVRLRGNPGKRRLNDAEPRPAAKTPSCPACLGDEARKEWKRLAKELAELGLLTGLDRAMHEGGGGGIVAQQHRIEVPLRDIIG